MKITFFLIGILLFHACPTPEGKELKKAEWLLGTWENNTPRGSIYEHWNKSDPQKFSGRSYTLKDRDTMVFETIQLIEEDGELFYIPTVRNQNDSLPVRFVAKEISGRQLMFENENHDFPQLISYRSLTYDSLVAEISGVINGEEIRKCFHLKRMVYD